MLKPRTPDPIAKPVIEYKWALVGMLWFICFFNYADRQAISSVLPVLEKDFGFSKEEQGLIGGAFMWVYGASAPLAGMVGDRVSRKGVILGGLYVWSLITGLTAGCAKVWQFIAVRAAEGLGETFYFPASMSLVSEYHGPETRSRAMALHQTSVYAGIIGGGVLTGWLAQHFGWQFPFILFGGAGIVLGLVLAKFLHEPRDGRSASVQVTLATPEADVAQVPALPVAGSAEADPFSSPRAETKAASEFALPEGTGAPVPWLQFAIAYVTRPASLTLLLAFVGANTVAGVFYVWMTTFVKERFNFNLATASLVGTLFIQIASMIGALCGGLLADRWRQHWRGGRAAVQGLGIVLGTPMILCCAWSSELWQVVAGLLGLGFAKGIYDSNIWPAIYEVVPASRRSSAVGMANMVGWGGAGVGTWQLGRWVDQGVPMGNAIAATAGIYVVVAVLLWSSALVFTPRQLRREESGRRAGSRLPS